MPIDIHAPALHACAYDAGHDAGQRDQASGRHSAALALESWLHQNPSNANYATSFLSGYEAGRN